MKSRRHLTPRVAVAGLVGMSLGLVVAGPSHASVWAPPVTGFSSANPPAAPLLGCRVSVPAGADLGAAIAAAAPATTFCLASGTYHLARPLVPKAGDAFVGPAAARPVIDASATTYGFDAHKAAGVVFENLVVTGATTPGRTACSTCGRGIWGGDAMQVFNVGLTNNAQDGIGGGDNVTHGWLIVGSQLTHNGSPGQGFAAAGVKSAKYYTLLNSVVSDNVGAGAWCDVGCTGGTWTVEGNTVADNTAGGIRYEISNAGAVISDNTVTGNNTSASPGAAGIEIISSGNTVVTYNTISTSHGPAIRVTNGTNRRRNAYGPNQIANNTTGGAPIVLP